MRYQESEKGSCMEERYIKGAGGKIYYRTNNPDSNITLVFTHGLTADHHLFYKQVDFFKDKCKIT